jgi:hypothetical protein
LGVPLFQEQLMQLAIDVAGFNPAEADQLRRTAPGRIDPARSLSAVNRRRALGPCPNLLRPPCRRFGHVVTEAMTTCTDTSPNPVGDTKIHNETRVATIAGIRQKR